MACKPTTLATKFGSTYLTQTSESLTNNLGFVELLQRENNPIERFDRDDLVSATQQFNATIRMINLVDYPYVDSRVSQGDILYPEFGDFIIQTGYTLVSTSQTIGEFVDYLAATTNSGATIQPDDLPTDYTNLISQLEGYYVENIANTVSGGFCSAFTNPFDQILNAIATIQLGVGLLEKLKNFSINDLFKQLSAIKDKLLLIVDKLRDSLIDQLQSIVDGVTDQFANLGRQSNRILKKIHTKVQNVKSFLDNVSVDTIKSEIEKFISESANQFEELTPESIALLLFRFCQFAELIQSFMKSPVDSLRTLVGGITEEAVRLETIGNEQTLRAVQAGGTRLSETGIRGGQVRMAQESIRKETGSKVMNSYLSSQENSQIANLSSSGIPGRITFTGGVTSMHTGNGRGFTPKDTYPGAGYAEVDHLVWQKVIAVSREFGQVLTVNSAYRSPQYNRRINGATSSYHVKGKALDISTNGFSDSQIRRLIELCSQVGFGGIGGYNSFIHVDIGPRRIWGPSGSRSSLNQTRFRSSLERHDANGYRQIKVVPSTTDTQPQTVDVIDDITPTVFNAQ